MLIGKSRRGQYARLFSELRLRQHIDNLDVPRAGLDELLQMNEILLRPTRGCRISGDVKSEQELCHRDILVLLIVAGAALVLHPRDGARHPVGRSLTAGDAKR